MQKLSKETEKRIMNALEKAADLINNGTHPNDALIKVATNQFMPGHIKLMVNAINTGRTNAHRLSHTDPSEKAANFPTADADVILKELYPEEVETEKDKQTKTAVSSEYNVAPHWLKKQTSRIKAAQVFDWKLTDKTYVPEVNPDREFDLAQKQINRLNIDINDARIKVAQNREQAVKIINEIRDYFNKVSHISFTQVYGNADAMFGVQGTNVLDYVKTDKLAKEKEGTHVPVNIKQAPYSLIKKAIDLSKEFVQNKSEYEQFTKEASLKTEELMRPFVLNHSAGHSVLAGQYSLTEFTKKALSFGDLIGTGFGLTKAMDVAGGIAGKFPSKATPSSADLQAKDLQNIYDPHHEVSLRNIQAEALLNDLMANDDVIRGHDPEDVVESFNEISQVAPYAATRKAMMRDLLRKRLSGGPQALDQFTIGDVMKSQETLHSFHSPQQGNLSVLSSIGVIPKNENRPQVAK